MRRLTRLTLAGLALALLAGCSAHVAEERAEAAVPPMLGDCRVLSVDDIAAPADDSPVVDCAEAHTAETFAIGTFPREVAASGLGSPALGAHVYRQCEPRMEKFLGGDESLVMRSIVTWAWFRPAEEAWDAGARWWRCDAVGGGEQSEQLLELPRTAKGILLGRPDDRWMVCVDGPTVSGSAKVPCSAPHTWRAVTTIVLGKEGDAYPGDRIVEVRTRDFCSGSVGAWLNYPVDYDFGYTWFHEAEWKAGNRRSICWARTTG